MLVKIAKLILFKFECEILVHPFEGGTLVESLKKVESQFPSDLEIQNNPADSADRIFILLTVIERAVEEQAPSNFALENAETHQLLFTKLTRLLDAFNKTPLPSCTTNNFKTVFLNSMLETDSLRKKVVTELLPILATQLLQECTADWPFDKSPDDSRLYSLFLLNEFTKGKEKRTAALLLHLAQIEEDYSDDCGYNVTKLEADEYAQAALFVRFESWVNHKLEQTGGQLNLAELYQTLAVLKEESKLTTLTFSDNWYLAHGLTMQLNTMQALGSDTAAISQLTDSLLEFPIIGTHVLHPLPDSLRQIQIYSEQLYNAVLTNSHQVTLPRSLNILSGKKLSLKGAPSLSLKVRSRAISCRVPGPNQEAPRPMNVSHVDFPNNNYSDKNHSALELALTYLQHLGSYSSQEQQSSTVCKTYASIIYNTCGNNLISLNEAFRLLQIPAQEHNQDIHLTLIRIQTLLLRSQLNTESQEESHTIRLVYSLSVLNRAFWLVDSKDYEQALEAIKVLYFAGSPMLVGFLDGLADKLRAEPNLIASIKDDLEAFRLLRQEESDTPPKASGATCDSHYLLAQIELTYFSQNLYDILAMKKNLPPIKLTHFQGFSGAPQPRMMLMRTAYLSAQAIEETIPTQMFSKNTQQYGDVRSLVASAWRQMPAEREPGTTDVNLSLYHQWINDLVTVSTRHSLFPQFGFLNQELSQLLDTRILSGLDSLFEAIILPESVILESAVYFFMNSSLDWKAHQDNTVLLQLCIRAIENKTLLLDTVPVCLREGPWVNALTTAKITADKRYSLLFTYGLSQIPQNMQQRYLEAASTQMLLLVREKQLACAIQLANAINATAQDLSIDSSLALMHVSKALSDASTRDAIAKNLYKTAQAVLLCQRTLPTITLDTTFLVQATQASTSPTTQLLGRALQTPSNNLDEASSKAIMLIFLRKIKVLLTNYALHSNTSSDLTVSARTGLSLLLCATDEQAATAALLLVELVKLSRISASPLDEFEEILATLRLALDARFNNKVGYESFYAFINASLQTLEEGLCKLCLTDKKTHYSLHINAFDLHCLILVNDPKQVDAVVFEKDLQTLPLAEDYQLTIATLLLAIAGETNTQEDRPLALSAAIQRLPQINALYPETVEATSLPITQFFTRYPVESIVNRLAVLEHGEFLSFLNELFLLIPEHRSHPKLSCAIAAGLHVLNNLQPELPPLNSFLYGTGLDTTQRYFIFAFHRDILNHHFTPNLAERVVGKPVLTCSLLLKIIREIELAPDSENYCLALITTLQLCIGLGDDYFSMHALLLLRAALSPFTITNTAILQEIQVRLDVILAQCQMQPDSESLCFLLNPLIDNWPAEQTMPPGERSALLAAVTADCLAYWNFHRKKAGVTKNGLSPSQLHINLGAEADALLLTRQPIVNASNSRLTTTYQSKANATSNLILAPLFARWENERLQHNANVPPLSDALLQWESMFLAILPCNFDFSLDYNAVTPESLTQPAKLFSYVEEPLLLQRILYLRTAHHRLRHTLQDNALPTRQKDTQLIAKIQSLWESVVQDQASIINHQLTNVVTSWLTDATKLLKTLSRQPEARAETTAARLKAVWDTKESPEALLFEACCHASDTTTEETWLRKLDALAALLFHTESPALLAAAKLAFAKLKFPDTPVITRQLSHNLSHLLLNFTDEELGAQLQTANERQWQRVVSTGKVAATKHFTPLDSHLLLTCFSLAIDSMPIDTPCNDYVDSFVAKLKFSCSKDLRIMLYALAAVHTDQAYQAELPHDFQLKSFKKACKKHLPKTCFADKQEAVIELVRSVNKPKTINTPSYPQPQVATEEPSQEKPKPVAEASRQLSPPVAEKRRNRKARKKQNRRPAPSTTSNQTTVGTSQKPPAPKAGEAAALIKPRVAPAIPLVVSTSFTSTKSVAPQPAVNLPDTRPTKKSSSPTPVITTTSESASTSTRSSAGTVTPPPAQQPTEAVHAGEQDSATHRSTTPSTDTNTSSTQPLASQPSVSVLEVRPAEVTPMLAPAITPETVQASVHNTRGNMGPTTSTNPVPILPTIFIEAKSQRALSSACFEQQNYAGAILALQCAIGLFDSAANNIQLEPPLAASARADAASSIKVLQSLQNHCLKQAKVNRGYANQSVQDGNYPDAIAYLKYAIDLFRLASDNADNAQLIFAHTQSCEVELANLLNFMNNQQPTRGYVETYHPG